MTRLFLLFNIWLTTGLLAQNSLTKDSFFLIQKNFPANYKTIISDNNWQLLGDYRGRVLLPDTITVKKIYLFENEKTYRRIKGNKIISNSDFAPETIIYVDSSTLILQYSDKYKWRRLYRRRD